MSRLDLVENETVLDCMKVFISYAWGDKAHEDWVRHLADRLIRNGVPTILDQYEMTLGQDFHVFMEKGIREASHVLVVCSTEYVRRANLRQGGVGVETSLAVPHAYDTDASGKI